LPAFIYDMLRSFPRAGEGVHNWLFRTSRVLHAFRSESEIYQLLASTAVGCGRVIPVREIQAAIRDSKECAWKPDETYGKNITQRQPEWPARDGGKISAISKQTGITLARLEELSPVECAEPQSDRVIDWLFPGNPLLCFGKSNTEFATRPRETWRGHSERMQFIVPSAMCKRIGTTKEGTPSEHCIDNTGDRQHLVIECDTGSTDEHAAVLYHLSTIAPLVLVVHSGGKSLHGWFYCAGQPEAALKKFMRYAVTLGADRATWTKSQFVRMPDGTRDGGKRQRVVFLNPKGTRPYAP
jgi:hypothetical protein